MAELALDDDQRNALARHLDGVRMTELVRGESPAYARLCSSVSHLRAHRGV